MFINCSVIYVYWHPQPTDEGNGTNFSREQLLQFASFRTLSL